MYTRCPECETMFHLTVADLRQAGGRVRCGECTHVFYGMDFLAEEPEDDTGHYAIEAESAETASATEHADAAPDAGEISDKDSSGIYVAMDASDSADVAPDDTHEISDEDGELGLDADLASAIDDFLGSGESAAGASQDESDEIAAFEVSAASEDPEPGVDEIVFISADESTPAADDVDEPDDGEALVYAADDTGRDDDEPEGPEQAEEIIYTTDDSADADDAAGDPDEPDDGGEIFSTAADYYLVEQDDSDGEPGGDDYVVEQESAAADSDDYLVELEDADDELTGNEHSAELADNSDDAEDLDIDDTIWDRIPGVGAVETDLENINLSAAHADDTGAFLSDSDHEPPVPISGAGAAPDKPDESRVLSALVSDDTGDDDQKFAALDDSEEETDDLDPDQTLEFNVPEEQWSKVFDTDANLSAQPDRIVVTEAAYEQTPETQADTAPPWQFNKYSNIDLAAYSGRFGMWLTGCLLMLALLGGQLVHYNRDTLASHPEYGEKVRDAYSRLGQKLYPAWSIDAYEIRGSEAVVGETGPEVMDIRTQIAAVGDYPVELPLLRVVLRDRWSNPVAVRNFTPAEYAAAEDLPAEDLLLPNSTITARVSIFDPGSGAQGYELELCIPARYGDPRCSGAAFK